MARVQDVVDLRHEDALAGLVALDAEVELVFLDADKDRYEDLLEPIVRALRSGGLLVAVRM